MPLFLRSLPLSLGTLWHYVFLLPLVAIASIPFALLALLPIVGLLVGPAISTFFTFAGYRCALAARGLGNEPSFGKLVRASVFYGVLSALVGAFFLLVSVAAVIGAEKLGIRPPAAPAEGGVMQWLPGVALLVIFALNSLFTIAIAVPMTAVAAQATPSGRDPGPFVGFGRGMVSLGLVWILWIVGIVGFGFFGILAESLAWAKQIAQARLMGQVSEDPLVFHLLPFLAALLYMLWGACWFYATAVLAWEGLRAGREVQQVQGTAAERMSAEDLRALRESRMQRNEDPGA